MGKLIIMFLFVLTVYAAATNHYITVAGAGTKTGATWGNAKSKTEFAARYDTAQAGDIFWIAGGTYTFTAQLNSCRGEDSCYEGTYAEPISVIGVKTGTTNTPPLKSDWTTGTDSPTLNTEGYHFVSGHYWNFRNLIIIVNSQNGFDIGTGCNIENCKITNTTAIANYHATTEETGCSTIHCEISSPLGYGIWNYGGCLAMFNDIHDCVTGIICKSDVTLEKNIIRKCSFGVNMNNTFYPAHGYNEHILNNSFSACSTGIKGQHPKGGNKIINNIFNCFTYDLSMDTSDNTMTIRYNRYTQSTSKTMLRGVDTSGVYQDYEWSGGDPLWTNPGSNNFTLQSSSPCKNAGLKLELGTH